MRTTIRHSMYGYEIDEALRIPLLMQRFMQIMVFLNTLLLSPIALYFVISSKQMKQRSVRIGHVLLRLNSTVQDIFFCFVYQPYPLFPLPAIACMGSLCGNETAAAQSLSILTAFHSVSILIHLFLLLGVQQAMQPRNSNWRLSTRQLTALLVTVAVLLLLSTGLLAASSEALPCGQDVLIEHNLTWLVSYTRSVVVYGPKPGDSGRQWIGVLAVFLCFCAVFSLILALVNSARLRVQEQQKTFDSSKPIIRRTWMFIVFKLVICTALYLLPGALYCAFALLPLDDLPDPFLLLCRVVFIVFISMQSTMSSLVMITRSINAKSVHHREMGHNSQPLVRSSRGAKEEGVSL